jgi:hypothetical protein
VWRAAVVAGLFASLATVAFQPAAQADSNWAMGRDIAGVRLGMTAALKAFNPSWKINSIMAYFNYSDGVRHGLQTPEFLEKIESTTGQLS